MNKYILGIIVIGNFGFQVSFAVDSSKQRLDQVGILLTPLQVTQEARAKQVTCGASHTVIQQTDHSVKWIGFYDTEEPPQLSGMGNITQIASGDEHTLLLRSDGSVWAYGKGEKGQLGNGKNTASGTPVRVDITGAIAIAAGGKSSLAICNDQLVRTWGSNEFGQLGDGTTENRSTPVTLTQLGKVTHAAMGKNHALLCKEDGTVWIWGNNKDRQIIDQPTQNITIPKRIPGLNSVKAIAVAAGEGYSLALLENKTVLAWGNNSVGQLGLEQHVSNTVLPTLIPGLENVEQIAAGSLHALARLKNGTLRAWGLNNCGQLGDGTRDNRNAPVPVKGLEGITDIAAGGQHSCVADKNHTVWTWGNNCAPPKNSADPKTNVARTNSADANQPRPPLITIVPRPGFPSPLLTSHLNNPATADEGPGTTSCQNSHLGKSKCIQIDVHPTSSIQ